MTDSRMRKRRKKQQDARRPFVEGCPERSKPKKSPAYFKAPVVSQKPYK